jgi:hypothetical protein
MKKCGSPSGASRSFSRSIRSFPARRLTSFASISGVCGAVQRRHGKLTVVYVMGVAGIVGVILQLTVV